MVSSKAVSPSVTQPTAQPARSLKKTIVGGLEGPAAKALGDAGKAVRVAAPRPGQSGPPQESVGTPEWTVAIHDRDHTEMSTRQVVELYAIGAISSETFVWKPGMETWKTPFTIPAIAAALARRGFKRATEPTAQRELRGFDAEDSEPANDEATVIQQVTLPDELATEAALADAPSRERGEFADRENLDEVTVAADSRRLLASLEEPVPNRPLRAYVDDSRSHDVVTVARPQSTRPPRPDAGPGEFARPSAPIAGELSSPTIYDEPTVLRAPDAPLPLEFDESAIGGDQSAERRAPLDEPTVRRPLEAAEIAQQLAERARQEAGEAAQAEPQAVPELEAAAAQYPGPRARPKRRIGWWLFGSLLLVGAAAAALYQFRPDLIASWVPQLAPLLPQAAPTPTPPAATAPASATPSVAAAVSALRGPEAPATPDAGATVESDAATDASESTQPPVEALGAFNKKAGWAALGVAGTRIAKCAEADAPSLSGEVLVTFIPSGRVANVEIKGELRDTPAGACVAQAFRRVSVPPFAGDPVHLARGVTVP